MSDAVDRRRAKGRIGTVLKDKWRIDARLGVGGMATVYSATHRNGNRVAIKMLHYDFSHDTAVKNRFLREGYLANAVNHPGAVKVLDDDVAEDGSAFLVMELLEGESLETRRMQMGGKLPQEEVFAVADQLLDLLAAAHQKGIVHRDVKPENIFLTTDGRVKLLDFGIAKMRTIDADHTGTGLMLGTPDFMSPEQIAGKREELDARTDIWAVGASMFTLLSGETVHSGVSIGDQLHQTATTRARSLAQVAPSVPPQLVRVIDRALELEKDRRWPSAAAMQDALRRAYGAATAAKGQPIVESQTMYAALAMENDVTQHGGLADVVEALGNDVTQHALPEGFDRETNFDDETVAQTQPISIGRLLSSELGQPAPPSPVSRPAPPTSRKPPPPSLAPTSPPWPPPLFEPPPPPASLPPTSAPRSVKPRRPESFWASTRGRVVAYGLFGLLAFMSALLTFWLASGSRTPPPKIPTGQPVQGP